MFCDNKKIACSSLEYEVHWRTPFAALSMSIKRIKVYKNGKYHNDNENRNIREGYFIMLVPWNLLLREFFVGD
jgi:hypothetical protein